MARYRSSKMWSGSGRCGKSTTWSGKYGSRMAGRMVARGGFSRKVAGRMLRAACDADARFSACAIAVAPGPSRRLAGRRQRTRSAPTG